MKHCSGFSLIEVIVALVLISLAGSALFSWMNSALISTNRLININQELNKKSIAIDFAQLINPYHQPQGKEILGNYQLEWQAELLAQTPLSRGLSAVGSYSQATLGVYKLSLKVQTRDSYNIGDSMNDSISVEIYKAGYKINNNIESAF